MSVEIFIKFGDIPGDAQDPDHPAWIDVNFYQWGFTPSRIGMPNLGAAAGKVNFQDLTFTCPQSKASPKLMEGCSTGKHFPKVVVDLAQPDATRGQGQYLTYELEDVVISSYQTGSTSGDDPLDKMSLTFQKVREIFEGQEGSSCGVGKGSQAERNAQ